MNKTESRARWVVGSYSDQFKLNSNRLLTAYCFLPAVSHFSATWQRRARVMLTVGCAARLQALCFSLSLR